MSDSSALKSATPKSAGSWDKNFFDIVEARRSIRRFTNQPVPREVIEKAFDAALLAPNSSNTQLWNFYWIQNKDKKAEMVKICLGQNAARTGQELIVAVGDPSLWKRSNALNIKYAEQIGNEILKRYYSKLAPMIYKWGFMNCFVPIKLCYPSVFDSGKFSFRNFFSSFFRPRMRGPHTKRDLQEVAIKSVALACQNFVLAVTAMGFDSCMMEGFDEKRLKKLLKLPNSSRVVMVIAVGEKLPESESLSRGSWGPRTRLPKDQVIHVI